MKMSSEKFMFVTKLTKHTTSNKPYYHITAELINHHRDHEDSSHGQNQTNTATTLNLVKCTEKHFENYSTKAEIIKRIITLGSLDEWLCPELNRDDMIIGGTWTAKDFDLI